MSRDGTGYAARALRMKWHPIMIKCIDGYSTTDRRDYLFASRWARLHATHKHALLLPSTEGPAK